MFCPNCGNQVNNNSEVCLHCGILLKNNNINNNQKEDDKSNVGLNIVSFFIPLIGLILYLALKKDTPIKAKSCGKSALFGVGATVLMYIVMFLLTFNTVNNQIDDARKKSLQIYSKSILVQAETQSYLDYIYNGTQKEFCYNIDELSNSNSQYEGSVKVKFEDNKTITKVWLTYDGYYIVTEYENKTLINEEIKKGTKINLTCKD